MQIVALIKQCQFVALVFLLFKFDFALIAIFQTLVKSWSDDCWFTIIYIRQMDVAFDFSPFQQLFKLSS